MSRTKDNIYTSVTTSDNVSARGTRDNFRLLVTQTIHSAPGSVGARDVELVLTADQALKLAVEIIGQLPVTAIEGDTAALDFLSAVLRITGRKVTHKTPPPMRIEMGPVEDVTKTMKGPGE